MPCNALECISTSILLKDISGFLIDSCIDYFICVQIYINVRESIRGLRDQNILLCGREGVVDLISPLIIFLDVTLHFVLRKV